MTVDLAMLAVSAAVGCAGVGFGLVYFALVRKSALLFVAPEGRALGLALTAGRMAAAACLLWLAARLGALPLLAALGGFLAARAIYLRRHRQES